MRLIGANTLPRTIWPTVRVGALGTTLVRPLRHAVGHFGAGEAGGGIGVGLGHAVKLTGRVS